MFFSGSHLLRVPEFGITQPYLPNKKKFYVINHTPLFSSFSIQMA